MLGIDETATPENDAFDEASIVIEMPDTTEEQEGNE